MYVCLILKPVVIRLDDGDSDTEAPMFRKLMAVLRGSRRPPAAHNSRNDTEHLRSSRANEARLNAAIEELDAGRGTLTSMSDLQGRLREVAAR
jgi:hypothetical protein